MALINIVLRIIDTLKHTLYCAFVVVFFILCTLFCQFIWIPPFLIALSVFSNVYNLTVEIENTAIRKRFLQKNLSFLLLLNLISMYSYQSQNKIDCWTQWKDRNCIRFRSTCFHPRCCCGLRIDQLFVFCVVLWVSLFVLLSLFFKPL